MTVADRIKERRIELNLSQTELAKRAGYSDKTSISKIENAGDDVTMKQVRRIAPALSVSIEYLMGWEKPLTEHYKRIIKYGDIINSLQDDELELISMLRSLNDKGKEKVVSYANDLACVDYYVNGIGMIETLKRGEEQ